MPKTRPRTPTDDVPPRSAWWPCALIVLGGLVAYANSFRGPFVFDDLPGITENTTIRKLSTALVPPENRSSVEGRPLLNLSFALNYAIGGYDPVGYHVVNLVIHVLAGLTLYGVVRRTLLLPRVGMRPDAARVVALGAALLWTVHPLQTESVTFIVQRSESLVGLLLLTTLYAFIRALENPTSRSWPTCAVLACVAGMACKELMVVAPLLALLYDRTFVSGGFSTALRQRWRLHLALAATWVLLGCLMLASGVDRAEGTVTTWQYLLRQCEAIVTYLKLALWPDPLVLDYGIFIVPSLRDVMPQAVLLVALVVGGAIAVWRWPLWGFLFAWFFAILAPSSSIVPLPTQTMAEHRMYLPLAALTTAAALGFHTWLRARSLMVSAVLAAVFIGLTQRRNQVYESAITIWTDTVEKVPHNARAINNLGKVFCDAGRFDEGFACFLAAERVDSSMPDTHGNLGLHYERIGRRELAEIHYRQAVRLQPDHAASRVNLGALLVETRRLAEAQEFLAETVRLLPTNAQAHINLGIALMELQRPRDAIAPLQIAVRLAPDGPEAHGGLANAFALSGQPIAAATHYETALKLNPEYVSAHENYGLLLLKQSQFQKAVTHFEAAVRLNPDDLRTRARLDYAREQLARSGGPSVP